KIELLQILQRWIRVPGKRLELPVEWGLGGDRPQVAVLKVEDIEHPPRFDPVGWHQARPPETAQHRTCRLGHGQAVESSKDLHESGGRSRGGCHRKSCTSKLNV